MPLRPASPNSNTLRDGTRSIRLRRICDPDSGNVFIVPLDHSLSDGPIASAQRWTEIVEEIALGGADAIIVHKGRVRFLPKAAISRLGIIVHLNGATQHGPDTNAKTSVASVEEALMVGADAVSLHINMGSDTENEQLRDFGRISGQCARFSVPLVAMIYPRGPRIGKEATVEQISHAANIAADLGADLVKVPIPARVEDLHDIVVKTPVPILVAGGINVGEDAFLRQIPSLMAAGIRGIAAGRNIFESADVRKLVGSTASVVHGRAVA